MFYKTVIKYRGASGRPYLFRNIICACLLSIFAVSCSGIHEIKSDAGQTRLIANVPFYPQEPDRCGPSVLAEALNFWNADVEPDKIASEVYSKSAKGTLDTDLLFYARKRGFKAQIYEGNIKDLEQKIDSGLPLIVMVDYGFWVYQKAHFMLVVGYGKDFVIANSGRERLKYISKGEFMRTWKRANYDTLLVEPGNEAGKYYHDE